MAFRDGSLDEDGEPTKEHLAGALLLAEGLEIMRAFYRAYLK